ncbi:MAG: hypothetical protein R2862_06005 [Thermoanaerobaculia bacterium]
MEIYRKLAASSAGRLLAGSAAAGQPAEAGRSCSTSWLSSAPRALRVQAIGASDGRLTFRLRRDTRIDVDRWSASSQACALARAFSPTGVLTLDLPAGAPVVEGAGAQAVLAELVS